LLVITLLVSACDRGEAPADIPERTSPGLERTLFINARIHTMDEQGTSIAGGAMAVAADGEILALGDSGRLEQDYPDARRVDLGGRTVLPGLIDSHGHLHGLAVAFTRANLVGARSLDEVIARLREFSLGLAEGEWLLGRGWDQNDWPQAVFPDRHVLDQAFPDRPVWLRRIDGHAAWGNSLAMAQADQELAGDWQPQGGWIQRDAAGSPTGIFIDGAMALVESAVPPVSEQLMESALDLALANMTRMGLTGVHDPGIDRAILELYRRKIEAGEFPLRVYAMADGMNETLQWLCREGVYEHPSGRLVMRAVKLYADGALGSRGAALLNDYSDEPGNRGLLFVDDQALAKQVRQAVSCGLQVGVHAIGDRANRQALDVFAEVLPGFPENPGRHRVEHAQIVNPDDLPRFAELGVVAAMQPTHATSDMYWAGERLGPGRLAGAYAWRSLLDSGAKLAFGSDFPVEEVNPMHGVYAAVSRRDLEGWPGDGWLPSERISRHEALRAFTLDAAWAGFAETRTGSLEVGKRADFIVLERDIMELPAEEIPGLHVEQTWLDGQLVYAR
jgi:predicted amidohydrolase YtcJ